MLPSSYTCQLWKLPIINTYELLTLAVLIINTVVYGILLGYPDLDETFMD